MTQIRENSPVDTHEDVLNFTRNEWLSKLTVKKFAANSTQQASTIYENEHEDDIGTSQAYDTMYNRKSTQ